jgi:hypothetical protein
MISRSLVQIEDKVEGEAADSGRCLSFTVEIPIANGSEQDDWIAKLQIMEKESAAFKRVRTDHLTFQP